MLAQVHLGASPGRRGVLATVCAAALLAALGLAWLQSRAAHAMGPEVRIPGTPLVVRVPLEWRADPNAPGHFLLPVHVKGQRGETLGGFERRVRFLYEKLPSFEGAARTLRRLQIDDPREIQNPRAVRVGPYAGLEVHRVETFASRHAIIRRDLIIRFATLPRGDVIIVTYDPLDQVRPADLEIMDEVCASLRIEDPQLAVPRATLLKNAGLDLTLDASWQTCGPHLEHVNGLYVGAIRDDVPIFSIGLFRTWLAPGRTPRDLLLDLGGDEWRAWELDVATEQRNGHTITRVRAPQFGESDGPLQSAWVVSTDPVNVVLMYVYSGQRHAEAADQAAARLADQMTIQSLHELPALDEPLSAGRRLVALLAERGALPRWGREAVDVAYTGTTPEAKLAIRSRRAATDRDPKLGYTGDERTRFELPQNRVEDAISKWSIDGHAAAYEYASEFPSAYGRTRIVEQRRVGGEVHRTLTVEGQAPLRWTFRPGELFTPPPTETIITGWVARGEAERAIFEASSVSGPSVHTELARRLAPDAGFPRVLLLRDYDPRGSIVAYNDDLATVEYEIAPGYNYHRAEAPSAP